MMTNRENHLFACIAGERAVEIIQGITRPDGPPGMPDFLSAAQNAFAIKWQWATGQVATTEYRGAIEILRKEGQSTIKGWKGGRGTPERYAMDVIVQAATELEDGAAKRAVEEILWQIPYLEAWVGCPKGTSDDERDTYRSSCREALVQRATAAMPSEA